MLHWKYLHKIRDGLNAGELFREGGVVRRNTGEIEMFLRESSGLSRELTAGNLSPSPLLSSQLSSLQSLSMAAIGMQALNLGISVIGFAIVVAKLNRIESKLNQLHQKIDRILAEVEWISRKQDLAMIAKMKGALETADRANGASANDVRRSGLIAAMQELTEASHLAKLCLNDLVSSKVYLSKPQLFDLYYRTWVCCRVAIMQCELLLDENNFALRDVQKTLQENGTIRADYLHILQNFDRYPLENINITPNSKKTLKEVKNLILDTDHQLKSYQLEIDYVHRNNIPYREWKDLGDSEEPRLSFLLPKER